MAYCPPMDVLGDFTSKLNRDYAKIHNLSFYKHFFSANPEVVPSWEKINVLISRFESNRENLDYLFWIDADSLVCNRDFDIRMIVNRYSDYDLIVGTDDAGICLGNFLIKNTDWSLNLLKTIQFLGPWKFEGSLSTDKLPKHEQDTLKALMFNFNLSKRIKELPHRFINAYAHLGYTKGDFILHAVSEPLDARLSRLKAEAISLGFISD